MSRTLFIGVFALIAIAAGGSILTAQSSSATLAVSVSVAKDCTISTSPVGFGAYDPVAANATAPLDGTGSVIVTCTKGATAHVGLDGGSNGQGTSRRMKLASGSEYLAYELYRDSSRSTVWGEGSAVLDVGAAPSRNPRTFTVYGRVPGGQDASVGAYADTVVAIVNF